MDRSILTEDLGVAVNHKLIEVSNTIVRLHLTLEHHLEGHYNSFPRGEDICLEVCIQFRATAQG